jgi:hypothetical protein
MGFEWYRKGAGELDVGATLRAMLTESGDNVFRIAFECDAETPRNYLFGAVVTRSAAQEPLECGWDSTASARCVYLCYELCDAFPLCDGGQEHARLEQTIERILGERVRLLPFTTFQRSIGQYPALLEIFGATEYAGIFRKDTGSLLDLKMHVVLSRWHAMPFVCPPLPLETPPRACKAAEVIPRDEWNTCFQSISSVFWYHAYVYELLGEELRDGFGLCNVLRTQDELSARGGADAPGKLALLDILKLVYRYNYSVA